MPFYASQSFIHSVFAQATTLVKQIPYTHSQDLCRLHAIPPAPNEDESLRFDPD